jgi:hypothetical protein
MITRGGTAKILDFGLARLVTSDLTRSNLMLGTMSYMAPEQLRNESIDQRVDVFAVGVVMYELFTGQRPFHGESLASSIYQVLEEDPLAVDQCNPSIPPELGPIVARALAKNRDERYPNMHELGQDLAEVQLALPDDLSAAPLHAPDASSDFEPTVLRDTPRALIHRTTPSPRPRTPTPGRPPSSGSRPSSARSQQPPASAPPAAAAPEVRSWRPRAPIVALAAVVLMLAVVATALLWRDRGDAASQATAPAPGVAAKNQQQAREHHARGRKALEANDYDTAVREARAALDAWPGYADAQQLMTDVETRTAKIEKDTREARRLYDAGRLEEAARAVDSVLNVQPDNAEARELMAQLSSNAQLSANARRESADLALRRLTQARDQATAAEARQHAPKTYAAARRAESEGRRRYSDGDYAGAATELSESSRLYRTAAADARRLVAEREQREAEAAEARASAELARRITTAREIYESRRSEAVAAGAPSRAAAAYNAALQLASNAARHEGEDAAIGEYEQAADMMADAQRQAVEAADRERAQAAQTTKPPAASPPPPSTPAGPPEPAHDELIREVLRQYVAALESRDLARLKRVWPSLSGAQERAIREDFGNAREIDVTIDNERIDIAGDSATVTCLRHYRLETRDNHTLQQETRTTIALRKTGRDSWIVDSIRYEQP